MSMKHKLTPQTYCFLMKRSKGRCEWCKSRDGCGIDHIMPRRLGGTNRRANLQYLCGRCGHWKGGDDPERVIQRIKRLKIKNDWSRAVKVVGLQKMREFVQMLTQESVPEDKPATFENPLVIRFGEGKVSCQTVDSDDGAGIVFGLFGDQGQTGADSGHSIVDGGLQTNQVLLLCCSLNGAEVLAKLACNLVEMMRDRELQTMDENRLKRIENEVLSGFQEAPESVYELEDLPN